MKKLLAAILIMLSFSLFTACEKKNDIEKVYQGSPEQFNSTKDLIMEDFNQESGPEKGDKIAVIKTNKGTIKIRLFPQFAPKTVENFTGLAEKNYYDGVIFHRVISDFMIQGGDPLGNGTGGESIWGEDFEDEFNPNLKNLRGALSMANTGKPSTNSSQFFIVQKEGGTPWLDNAHTVFGQVFEGMDVVDEIANVEINNPVENKPIEDVVMEKVSVETY